MCLASVGQQRRVAVGWGARRALTGELELCALRAQRASDRGAAQRGLQAILGHMVAIEL